jgi:hypothetical protein
MKIKIKLGIEVLLKVGFKAIGYYEIGAIARRSLLRSPVRTLGK